MPTTQSCPNCERAHDVAKHVSGQKIVCACGIRFEVKRNDVSVVGGGGSVNRTMNLRTPLGTPVVARPNAAVPLDADVTFRPQSRASGNHRVVSIQVGPASLAANGGAEPAAQDVAGLAPTPDAVASVPDVRLPGYELERLLGRGGMGEVWRAKQVSLGRTVAVKLLPEDLAQDREFVARFEKEATALASLSHPNIIQIIDRGEAGGHYYFVMEYVDGKSLRERMGGKPLVQADAIRFITQILRAVEAAHEGGIIHRDLKPENILLDGRGHAKVADFGLAGMRSGDERKHQLTGTSVAMGTLNYMAPEQRRDARNVDHRADLYSVGVILYELLTGDLPVGRFKNPSERVPGCDARLDDIVARLLETEPADRCESASWALAALEPLQSSTSRPSKIGPAVHTVAPASAVSNLPPSTMAPSIVERGFRGLRSGLVVIGVLAIIAFGARMFFNREVTAAAGTRGQDARALPTATANSDVELFAAASVEKLDDPRRERLEVSFAPGEEEVNVHSGEWSLDDGSLRVVQVGNEVETGEKIVPRAYLAKRYFSADDFDAEVDVEYRDVRSRYLLPEDGVSRFAELAFRIKNVQVSVFAIPGGDARMLWHYFTPDGVELADNSSRRIEEGLDDVTPAPKDGARFKLRLRLRKVKDGVEARAFLNGNELARKVLPGLSGQVGKLALGCRNYECVFRDLSVEAKPVTKPARRVASQSE